MHRGKPNLNQNIDFNVYVLMLIGASDFYQTQKV